MIVPLPIIISREDKWFVASCPLLDVATQGKTEEEVRGNIKELIEEYMKDPDTTKPAMKAIMSTSVSLLNIPVEMKGAHYGKAPSIVSA